MKTLSISDARNGLSALIREVRGGTTIVITDRGVPVAQLAPLLSSSGMSHPAVELAQRGRLILPAASPIGAWQELPFPRETGQASAVAALLAERAGSDHSGNTIDVARR